MSRSFGTGSPIFLKCSKCRRTSDTHRSLTGRTFYVARSGDLRRTGRTREKKIRGALGLRSSWTAHECKCLECGHVGWYRHKEAARKPLIGG